MAKNTKLEKLEKLTSDYMDAVSQLFPKDVDAERAFEAITLTEEDLKGIQMLDLDSLSALVVASILGY